MVAAGLVALVASASSSRTLPSRKPFVAVSKTSTSLLLPWMKPQSRLLWRRPSRWYQGNQVEKPKAVALVAFEVNIVEPMSNASFSLDAIGNGTVAEVLGRTLDQCANAMVMEINMAYSTRNTSTSSDAEVNQTDNESTGVISVDDSTKDEAEIAVETVSEDDDDAGNKPESVR